MNTRIHTQTCTRRHARTCTHVCVHTCARTHMHKCAHTCTHMHMHTCAHTCTHMHMRARTHTHTSYGAQNSVSPFLHSQTFGKKQAFPSASISSPRNPATPPAPQELPSGPRPYPGSSSEWALAMAFGVHDLPLSYSLAHPCFCIKTFVPLTLLSMQVSFRSRPKPRTPGISAAPQLQCHPHPWHLALSLWPVRDAR